MAYLETRFVWLYLFWGFSAAARTRPPFSAFLPDHVSAGGLPRIMGYGPALLVLASRSAQPLPGVAERQPAQQYLRLLHGLRYGLPRPLPAFQFEGPPPVCHSPGLPSFVSPPVAIFCFQQTLSLPPRP